MALQYLRAGKDIPERINLNVNVAAYFSLHRLAAIVQTILHNSFSFNNTKANVRPPTILRATDTRSFLWVGLACFNEAWAASAAWELALL
ncbi:hypothetical protein EVAR_9133_1 [Eumeta japonica]|uniref:Uncharacterized protein n=1 Tax=Eumeta variegata TaxID=151549 RepID=A0A4C1TW84_EUMVA|nr:hypothetical protein EVAR_9133_1 [Eumeta japonica]